MCAGIDAVLLGPKDTHLVRFEGLDDEGNKIKPAREASKLIVICSLSSIKSRLTNTVGLSTDIKTM